MLYEHIMDYVKMSYGTEIDLVSRFLLYREM